MNNKTLLINKLHEPLAFITFRKLIKFIVKGKVDVIATWDEVIHWGAGKMEYPAIVRLTHEVKRMPIRTRFNRRAVFRRDLNQCQYCGDIFSPSRLTIDHVIPTSKGGKLAWNNVLTSCEPCNAKKGNRTPKEAGMTPLSIPSHFSDALTHEYILLNPRHDDWDIYFKAQAERIINVKNKFNWNSERD